MVYCIVFEWSGVYFISVEFILVLFSFVEFGVVYLSCVELCLFRWGGLVLSGEVRIGFDGVDLTVFYFGLVW